MACRCRGHNALQGVRPHDPWDLFQLYGSVLLSAVVVDFPDGERFSRREWVAVDGERIQVSSLTRSLPFALACHKQMKGWGKNDSL